MPSAQESDWQKDEKPNASLSSSEGEDKREGLSSFRDRINAIDEQVLDLLNRRAEMSIEVGKLKNKSSDAVFKPSREKEVLTRIQTVNPGPLPDAHLRAIYREILSSSRKLQRPQKVVYLGPEGTFSYFAGIEYLGHSADFQPRPTLTDVFESIMGGEASLGIIPLENSLQGTVGQSLDLFMRFDVFIHAEIYFRIAHSLLTMEDSMADVNVVYSHTQALEQCGGWLRANLPRARIVPMESTAAAARRVSEERGSAAIGHRRLAQLTGLKILAERIQDLPDNWTRFLIIASQPTQSGNQDKTSILFTTQDKPGALAAILNILAYSGINLKKLESRPFKGEKWKYVFFADLECDLGKPEYKNVREQLEKNSQTLRILGSYPSGPHLDVRE